MKATTALGVAVVVLSSGTTLFIEHYVGTLYATPTPVPSPTLPTFQMGQSLKAGDFDEQIGRVLFERFEGGVVVDNKGRAKEAELSDCKRIPPELTYQPSYCENRELMRNAYVEHCIGLFPGLGVHDYQKVRQVTEFREPPKCPPPQVAKATTKKRR